MFRTKLVRRALNSSHHKWPGGKIPRETMDIVDIPCTPQTTQITLSIHSLLACPQHSMEGIQMSAERAHLGRLELLWLPNPPGRNLRHTAAIFAGKRGQMSSEQLKKMGHSASTRLTQMKELLPTQAAASQPSSQRSSWFQLTEPVPAHFRDRLENRC